MKKSAYIVLTHTYQNEKLNGVVQKGKINVSESCEFVDRIRKRDITQATAILDVLEKKLVKNRMAEMDYPAYVTHIKKTYGEKYDRFLTNIENTYGISAKEE